MRGGVSLVVDQGSMAKGGPLICNEQKNVFGSTIINN